MDRAILPYLRPLTAHYRSIEGVLEFISILLVGRLNGIMTGPGGHAKSELADLATRGIQGARSGVVMFGEGMTEDRLWGGINLNALNDPADKRIEYYLDNSFLAWDMAVFEELFDAPIVVLMALKYVLTARAYKSNNQHYPMKTFSIIAATNHDPHEIATLGPAQQALVERLLHKLVLWEQYTAHDYKDLFERVQNEVPEDSQFSLGELQWYQARAAQVHIPQQIEHTLSNILGQAADERGIVISPRTAVMCLRVIKAAAAIRGNTKAEPIDVRAIQYLPGCSELGNDFEAELADAIARSEADGQLAKYRGLLKNLQNQYRDTQPTPIKFLQLWKLARKEYEAMLDVRVPDAMMPARAELLQAFEELMNDAFTAATNATRLKED